MGKGGRQHRERREFRELRCLVGGGIIPIIYISKFLVINNNSGIAVSDSGCSSVDMCGR